MNPNRIAILPFRVSGADPALAYLRDGMVDLLAAEFIGEGAPAAADVVGTAQRLYLSATILGVPRGEVRVPQVRVEGSADSLTVMLRDLMARLVTGRRGVWRLTANDPGTTSNEALHAYMAGRAAYRTGAYGEAARQLQRALTLDSTFVLAAYSLFLVNQWGSGAISDLGPVRRAAVAGRARLGVEERALLDYSLGPRYTAGSTPSEQLTASRRAAALAPLSPEAHFLYGDVLFHWGETLGIAAAPSLSAAEFEASLALDTTADALIHLVELALADGDPARAARAVVTSAARAFLNARSISSPDSVGVDACSTALRLAEAGDTTAARALLGAPADDEGLRGLCAVVARAIAVAATDGSLAALESADSLLRQVPAGWTSWLQFGVAQAWARRGRYREAARRYLRLRTDPDGEVVAEVHSVRARLERR